MEEANEWMRQMKKVENKAISNNNNSDNDDDVSDNHGGDDDNNSNNKGRQRHRQHRRERSVTSETNGDALDDFRNTVVNQTTGHDNRDSSNANLDENNDTEGIGKNTKNGQNNFAGVKSSTKDRGAKSTQKAADNDSDEDIDLPGI